MPYQDPPTPTSPHPSECTRLEAVTTCVGFDDILDETLPMNHQQVDTMIVVTSHDDKLTQAVAHKHGAICVQTDLFKKNGRTMNKGAAINAGFMRFQYHGWRLHLDADIVLPDNFRRVLFNHTALDLECIYGADRVDVVGLKELNDLRAANVRTPQAAFSYRVSSNVNRPVSGRYVDPLSGYVPIGYFQLWFADSQHSYPYGLGTAGHDDVAFAMQWGESHRRHLPTVICYHLCARPPQIGENWDGQRRQPRLK
jgi:hypothetical protein